MEEVASKVKVSGRVTGVGFRYCTRGEARRYPGLKGFVRNVSFGRVECVLQGAPSDVRAMQLWLRSGPETAVVSEFTVEEIPVDPDMALLHVRL